jgi:hypothetical protein
MRMTPQDQDWRRFVYTPDLINDYRPLVILNRHMTGEEEKIWLFLYGFGEPCLVDHVLYFLNRSVLVIAGKVEQDTKGGNASPFTRFEFGISA